MRIIVSLPHVRMVGFVWMIMVATHVSVLDSGLDKIVQVFYVNVHHLPFQ